MMMLGVLLTYAGAVAIGLSIQRHHQEVFGKPPARALVYMLRCAGYCLLVLGAWPFVHILGRSIGIVAWAGVNSLSAFLAVLTLTYRPWRHAPLGGRGSTRHP